MSLLHQESQEEIDDAALGEEFTKGSSHVVLASVIATVLVTVVVAIVVLASHKPPVASGEIVQVWDYPEHGETSGIDANGDAMAKESFDQVLLFAHVKLHNQSKVPLILQDVLANVRLADGVPLSVSAGSVAQFEEAFLAFPADKTAMGRAQGLAAGPESQRPGVEVRTQLHLLDPVPARPGARAPNRCYGTVAGTGAFFGVVR